MTDEQRQTVLDNSDLSVRALGKVLGVHHSTAADWRKRLREADAAPTLTQGQGEVRVLEGRLSHTPQSPEELLEQFGVDLSLWVPTHTNVNRWEQGAKLPDGSIVVTPLYQTKVSLKAIPGAASLDALGERIIRSMGNHAPAYEPVERTPRDGVPVMLEISLPDYHLGKRGLDGQVQGVEAFKSALKDLVAKASGFNIARVVFPIGNDFLQVDGPNGTTTRGTPVAVSGEWEELMVAGLDLLVWGVEYLRQVGPVHIVPVGGNHDRASAFSLGMALAAWFRRDPEVTVDQSTRPRKYVEFGRCLLGLTHGDQEKSEDLPGLMAMEQPEAWGRTFFREFHRGHLHRKRNLKWVGTLERKGVVVRELGSLSILDRWHDDNGFTDASRTGEAFVWHPTQGMVAYFGHHL